MAVEKRDVVTRYSVSGELKVVELVEVLMGLPSDAKVAIYYNDSDDTDDGDDVGGMVYNEQDGVFMIYS